MGSFPEERQRTIASWFFKYVAWPSLRHVLADLFPPGDMAAVKESIGFAFAEAVDHTAAGAGDVKERLAGAIDGRPPLNAAPVWIKTLVVGVIDEFTRIVSKNLNGSPPENEDLAEYVENAMVVYLFDSIYWKFPHDMLLVYSRLSTGGIAEIKEKLLEQLRRYLDGDLTFKEAKRAAGSFLETIALDNDLAHEVISSYVATFYEIINGLDPPGLHEYIEAFQRSRGGFLETLHVPDTDMPGKAAVLRWFEEDVVSASMKAIAELYPELTPDDITGWKGLITKDLGLVLQSLLSFEDFEKRLLAKLKLPRLEFDIEKPGDGTDVEDHFFHIEDRGGAIETIIASAEMIYQESLKDATLNDLAARIESRKNSLENMYM